MTANVPQRMPRMTSFLKVCVDTCRNKCHVPTSFERIWIGLCSSRTCYRQFVAPLLRVSGLGCVLLRTCYRQCVGLFFRASGLGCVHQEPVTASMLPFFLAHLDWAVFPKNLLPPVCCTPIHAAELGSVLLRTCYRRLLYLLISSPFG